MTTDRSSRMRGIRLAGLIVMGLIGLQSASVFAQGPSITRTQAPNWELSDVNGKTVKRSRTLSNCKSNTVTKLWGIIGVSLDEQGPEVVKKFVNQFQMTYPVVIGNEKIAASYGGVEGIFTSFVIDRQGRIVREYIGYADKAVFETEIQSLL